MVSRNFRQKAFSQAICAMGIQGIHIVTFQRSVFTDEHRYIQPVHLFQNLFGIFKSHLYMGIATDNGDSHYFDLRRLQCQHDGETVINARITVNNNFSFFHYNPFLRVKIEIESCLRHKKSSCLYLNKQKQQ